MAFPNSLTAPIGTLHKIPKGSTYVLNSKRAWELKYIGRGYFEPVGKLDLQPEEMPTFYVGTAVADLSLVASGGVAPYFYSVISGALPAGLSLNGTTGAITGTPTTPGAYAFRAYAYDSTGGTPLNVYRDYIGVVQASAIVVMPESISGLQVGKPFTVTHTASGGTAPYTWSIVGGALPAGLSLDATTGEVSGVPTTKGPFSYDIRATDVAAKTGHRVYGGIVAANPIDIRPKAMPALTVGEAVRVQFTATGGVAPYTWSTPTGALPAGLTLNTTTGVISGTPTTPGAYSFSLRAVDSVLQEGQIPLSGVVGTNIGKIWNPHKAIFPGVPLRGRHRAADDKFRVLVTSGISYGQGTGPTKIQQSADGITWAEETLPVGADKLTFIGTLNSKSVMAGWGGIWIDGVAAQMPTNDAIIAAMGATPGTLNGYRGDKEVQYVFGVAYGDGYYVAVGTLMVPGRAHPVAPEAPFILRADATANPIVFTAVAVPPEMTGYNWSDPDEAEKSHAGNPMDVIFAFGRFIMLSNHGISTSTTGAGGTWTYQRLMDRINQSGSKIREVDAVLGSRLKLVNNVLYIFGGIPPGHQNPVPLWSTDGLAFQQFSGLKYPLLDMDYNGDIYVGSTWGQIGVSPDLLHWTWFPTAAMDLVLDDTIVMARPGGGKFVIVGHEGHPLVDKGGWARVGASAGSYTSYP